ncbi:CHAT domain-containing protein [Aspergillus pseudocaelatus]|uniref:CHAT domain-containing protein n=1 Tax=Aspergillus pseudocaelatus TaxID=1825620 RepID=A0ABQ6WZE7_9EURO|nr:CHAT domain-containing protein [Aspergillus pseudocaelatus]
MYVRILRPGIDAFRRAAQLAPNNHPSQSSCGALLRSSLIMRFLLRGDPQDIHAGISMSRETTTVGPGEYAHRAWALYRLGGQLDFKYAHTGNVECLHKEICACSLALDLPHEDHVIRAKVLSLRGHFLWELLEHTGGISELEMGIADCKQAAEIMPQGHHDLPEILQGLAFSFQNQYQFFREMKYLEEAISTAYRTLRLASIHGHDMSKFLGTLSIVLLASPFGRIRSANRTVRIYIDQSDFEKAYKLVIAAINILPLVHNRSLTLQGQQEVVKVFSGLATDAFSLALKTKQPPLEALDLLERGRGVILSLLMNDQSDMAKRWDTHPGFSLEVENPLYEMHSPTVSLGSGNAAKHHSDSQRGAQGGPEAPPENVQSSPTVDPSKKRVTEEEVKEGAARGRIIIVNITSVGSEALVISSTGLKLIHLRDLISDEAREWIKKDMTATSGNRGANNKAYLRFLSWLWRVCVKPIFNELEYKVHESSEEMPRVWWIGIGLASSFPFHAAGNHLTEPNESTNSRVLSYTLSLRDLLYTRSREPLSDQEIQCPKLLTVSMATTPGADELDGVFAETVAVTDIVGNYVHAECLSQPDADTVKRRLSGCYIAHFACHGVSEPRDPSQSGLLFQTVGDSPEQVRLTVGSLCDTDCSQGQIAYLSACSTAENRSKWLVDEVLHVVSGFQVAGFRNVIGCLWPADDMFVQRLQSRFILNCVVVERWSVTTVLFHWHFTRPS